MLAFSRMDNPFSSLPKFACSGIRRIRVYIGDRYLLSQIDLCQEDTSRTQYIAYGTEFGH